MLGIISKIVAKIKEQIKVKSEQRKLRQLHEREENLRRESIRREEMFKWESHYLEEKRKLDDKLIVEKAKADARAKVFGDGRPSFMEKLNERREYVKARNRVEQRSPRMAEPEPKKDVEGALKKLWG